MTTLWLRSRNDVPHRLAYGIDPKAKRSACGKDLAGAEPITEEQALVYLDDRRCLRCFPSWHTHNAPMHGRKAAA